MAYIGNTVQNQGFAPAVDYFSGNGVTVTFTLSRPVASVAQLTAVIDNVIQNPSSAFTVSGNAITFTSAPLSGTNNIWVEYTSLVTTYAAISQDPSVIGDITASGGYLSTGDFGNSYIDGTIVDYVTGNSRITTGPADGLTIYNGGTTARTPLTTWTAAGNVGIGVTSPQCKLDVLSQLQARYTANDSAVGMFHNGSYGAVYSSYGSTGSYTPLSFRTSDVERMNIDTSGRVTAPYQPAFHVRVNQNAYLNTSPLPFATSVFDIGSNFNTSTYRFTAPVAGRYGFLLVSYAKIASAGGNSVWKLRVNASDRQYSEYQNPAATAYLSVSAQAIFNLSAGDYVDVAFSGSQTYYAGSQETNFFGWLIG